MARTKSTGGPSKADMVRDALQELGNATPKEMQAWIKSKYGEEIKTQMLSSYKSNLGKKKRKGAKTGPKPKAAGGGGGGSIGVDELMALRKLIVRVGADQVQSLIKVLS
jgi:hypothetical protein